MGYLWFDSGKKSRDISLQRIVNDGLNHYAKKLLLRRSAWEIKRNTPADTCFSLIGSHQCDIIRWKENREKCQIEFNRNSIRFLLLTIFFILQQRWLRNTNMWRVSFTMTCKDYPVEWLQTIYLRISEDLLQMSLFLLFSTTFTTRGL